jgi:hypothetical protein
MWEWLHPSNPDPFMKNDLREGFLLAILQPFDFEILLFFGFILLARLLS